MEHEAMLLQHIKMGVDSSFSSHQVRMQKITDGDVKNDTAQLGWAYSDILKHNRDFNN
jgi:hypothetical protein